MTDDALAAIQRRLARVEDELAIERLIASYGPLVDAGDPAAAQLWTEDGTYDVAGMRMRSRAEIAEMVHSDDHQGLVALGCSHFHGPAVVHVDGDHATAVCESLLVLRRDERYVVWRAGASRFRLRRTDEGWRISERITRTFDGGAETRELLSAVRGGGR